MKALKLFILPFIHKKPVDVHEIMGQNTPKERATIKFVEIRGGTLYK
jgi:hypothetical protein